MNIHRVKSVYYHRGGLIDPPFTTAVYIGLISAVRRFSLVGVSQMSNLQQRLAAITDTAANLIARLSELNQLRDQLRRKQLSARRTRRTTYQRRRI